MAGQKFGTTDDPARTWAMNTLAPAIVAERFKNSKIVAFSTGCVYPDVRIACGGSVETDTLEPIGEYANSCVGRERIFEYFAARYHTKLVLLRLNYSIALRYGVLTDIALRVKNREPIDLTTGFANVIWEGDACNIALQCLTKASVPPLPVNVTGRETISIREVATRLASIFGVEAHFTGSEREIALLSNSSKMIRLFGPPETTLDQMIEWTAEWIMAGLPLLDKPTHYEVRDGRF
jgi:nucleoside-diphosphate-sugar epimerase